MQPIKNLVKIKDYHSYILRQTAVWNTLKSNFTVELEQINNKPKPVKKFNLTEWYFSIKPLTEQVVANDIQEVVQKLNIVQQRLELLENEWNRTEYYILYKFEMIEILPELTDSFFSYAMQQMKSSITYN